MPLLVFSVSVFSSSGGVEITDLGRTRALTISHDEWLEYRYAPGQDAFVQYFREWIEPSLRQGASLGR